MTIFGRLLSSSAATSTPLLLLHIFLLQVFAANSFSKCKWTLRWAPRITRNNVFTTFVNHPHCPTWVTKNPFTKDPTGRSDLVLPKGTPFAFFCGACFLSSSLPTNLTASIHDGTPLAMKPLAARGTDSTLQHSLNHLNCLISYGITDPVYEGSEITCLLNRGKNTYSETIRYSVREVTSVEEPKEEKSTNSDGIVILQCPEEGEKEKGAEVNRIRVWHYVFDEQKGEGVKIMVPSTEAKIAFRPTKELTRVSCTTYDFADPKEVRSKTYVVTGGKSRGIRVGKDQRVGSPAAYTLNSRTQILLVTAAVVVGICIASAVVCASFGLCRCGKREQNPYVTNTDEVVEETPRETHPLTLFRK